MHSTLWIWRSYRKSSWGFELVHEDESRRETEDVRLMNVLNRAWRCSHCAPCTCQAAWTSPDDGRECSATQAGCTNCDADPNGAWCLVDRQPCAGSEGNGDWFYCGAATGFSAAPTPLDSPRPRTRHRCGAAEGH